MTLAIKPYTPSSAPFLGVDNHQVTVEAYFQITLTGNYPGGLLEVLDFTGLGDLLMVNNYSPVFVEMKSQNPAGPSGYQYEWTPAAVAPTMKNGSLSVLQPQGALGPALPIPTAAYPAAVLGDTIIGRATFTRL